MRQLESLLPGVTADNRGETGEKRLSARSVRDRAQGFQKLGRSKRASNVDTTNAEANANQLLADLCLEWAEAE